jgi:hypothetical protein
MISTLKNLFNPVKTSFQNNLTLQWYLISLAVERTKHSLENAAELSGINACEFSRLLSNNKNESEKILLNLSKKAIQMLRSTESHLTETFSKLPWKVYLIIDSTPQKRSASHAENLSRHNLGGGFWFGHKWTNVVLFINGHLIPLAPIPYYSKKACKAMDIVHQTEVQLVCNYLDSLSLSEWIPGILPQDVAVLMDAGYDAKVLQNKILSKKWDLLMAIGKQRNILISHEKPSHYGKPESKVGVFDAFQRFNRRAEKITCKLPKLQGQKKRKIFTVKRLNGKLSGVRSQNLAILSSQTKRQKKIKYIVCSRSNLPTWMIVQAFSIRFYIEQFHKEIKQYFGFEDMASKRFDSVISHVNFVYSVYHLLNIVYRDKKIGMKEKQKLFTEAMAQQESATIIQLSTRFDGKNQIRKFFEKKYSKIAA